MKQLRKLLVLALIPLGFSAASLAQEEQEETEGQALFEARCAACHVNPEEGTHTPNREDMALFTPNSIYAAMAGGVMQLQATGLSDPQMRDVARFLTGKSVSDISLQITTNLCASNPPMGNPALSGAWNGWGSDVKNARFQSAAQGGITAADLPRLKLKWAYGLPGEGQPRAQPSVVAGRLFVGNRAGALYALDAQSGCTYWSFLPRSGIRSALSVGAVVLPDGSHGYAVYFVDIQANAYAVNAQSGEVLWVRKVEEHPAVRGTGSVTLHNGRLYVPITGVSEENAASDPDYACCTFRGSISALDARTGELIWKYYTVPEPQPRGLSSTGVQLYGPAGVGIWSAPTIDADRGLLYAATGNAYAQPAPETTDAVIALSLASGELQWLNQLTPGDAWIGGCNPATPNPNCPEDIGPDFDFSASPILTATPGGRELLVVPQKSGMAYALDPNNRGALVWEYRAGAGSPVGGVWGMAVGNGLAYVAVGGYFREQSGGIHGIDLETGKRAWYTPPQDLLCQSGPGCSATQSAAVTAIPGAVFSGAADGGMRAYAAGDGRVLWTFDANRRFETGNGVEANGASFDGPGPIVAGGMLYFLSGNAGFVGRPGNVLLAFELATQTE
ncbi:MAG: PQQ-binding-like beta-propeller repeat protein [Pseudomonadales bacterium]|nr:PQQ-binding-like beta-propeller repeat protein [Pseudomonadales bacterium]